MTPVNVGYAMQEGVEIRRPPFNGPANHVREVVESLSRRGHRVRVLVRIGGGIWRSDDLTTFTPVHVRRWDRGPLRLLERGVRRLQSDLGLPYAAAFESLRFAQACVEELHGCDLLYERFGWMGYGCGLAARRLRVPLVLEDNGDHLLDLEAKHMAPTGVQRRVALALMRRAVRRASHVVSTGAGWREQFIRRWGIEGRRVTAIENGTLLTRLLDRDQLRSFGPAAEPGAPVTLVYVGGFYPWHGVPILLRAVAGARAAGAQVRLMLIGSGERAQEARDLTAELGLADSVTFAGHLQPAEYAPLLAAADAGVSPYCGWPEFSGLKVLDYKAAGLPTIASGTGGHPPTVRDGHTGMVVPPCGVEALRDAIVRLCANPSLRRRMGQAARLEAERLHAWEHTAERLEAIFAAVAAEGRQ